MNPLVHYLLYGRAEGRRPRGLNSRIRSAIRAALPGLLQLEPQLQRFVALRNPDLLADRDPFEGALPRAFGAFFNSLDKAFDRIIFVPSVAFGGAELVAMLIAKAAVDTRKHHSVLIVIADSDQVEAANWLPPGAELRAISTFDPRLDIVDRTRFVASAVEAIRPKAVMNVNSLACWNAYKMFGKSLANATDLYAMLFARDYDEQSKPVGYSDSHFRDCFPYLRRIYFDTQRFPRELATTYGLTAQARSKLLCIRPPPQGDTPAWTRSSNNARQRFSVLWAGR